MRQYRPQIKRYPSRRRKRSFWGRFFGRKKKIHSTTIQPPKNSWGSSNPWNQKKQTPNWHVKAVVILLLILFLAWVGLLLYLPYFKMDKISITGLKIISPAEMETYVRDTYLTAGKILPINNYFWVDKEKISSDLKERYLLSDIQVQKIFPRELKIEATEKSSTVIYDNGIKSYLLDKEGTVIMEIFTDIPTMIEKTIVTPIQQIGTSTPTVTSTVEVIFVTSTYKPDLTRLNTKDVKYLPVIYDTRKSPIEVKQTMVLPPNLISTIIDWQGMAQKQGIGKVAYFEISENPASGIKSYLNKRWYVIFSPKDDLETQINNLQILLREIKPNEYVDLRYGEKVFWK